MTSKVFEFLSDSGGSNFTESAPRPPVPGEENELQSNGGMSTRSSGSHRSTKSHSSSKSSTKGDVSQSPAATPRKSNLEKGDASTVSHPIPQGLDSEDVDAPLGFEPEGSVAYSPPYSENSTPPPFKWAENLNHLLNDSEGVALFKDFLEQEQGGADALQFWFACQGLKQKADTGDVTSIVKVIYKTYVRVDKVKCISKETKKEITDKISQKVKIDQCIFDAAQAEVENHLRTVSYTAFLNSDLYVQYVQNYEESPKSSHSSGSNSARPVSQSGLLPVLHEDKELAAEDFPQNIGVPFPKPPPATGRRSDFLRRPEPLPGIFPFSPSRSSSHPQYASHVSYAPVSAQDSELQSLSSDALTDDTVSVTDGSSVDGNMTYKNSKRMRKAMKTNAFHNREYRTGLHTQIIPRTEHAPKDRNIAETDPERFAQLLIEKLEKEVEEREAVAKVEERLKMINQSEVAEEVNTSFAKNTTATSIIPLMPGPGLEEETAESILDQHCSRIWDNSLHHTPSRSPGRQSPRTKSPDRSFARPKAKVPPPVSAMGPSASAVMNSSFPRYRGKKDTMLSKSYDSGMGEETMLVRGETHRHIHHHHHHHHREIINKQRIELEAQQSSMMYQSTSFEHGRGRTNAKKSVARKSSDASSNIDSGISMVFESDSTRVMPNFNNPSSEKVMKWILQSEKVTVEQGSASLDAERSSSSHTKRHRYPPASATSQHKPSGKKTGTHMSSRSASNDRSGMNTWGSSAPILPNQPFIQDSNMPPPTPPNPTTQLEEAKRRLEDQSRAAGPVKSKSFPGVPSKEKTRIVPGTGMPLPAHMSSVRTVPSDLDTSASSIDYSQHTPRPSGGGASNVHSDSTVVGIFIDQEPIPYRFTVPGRNVTLAQVRALIMKRGTYKYFFKSHSDEFGESGAVWEEIKDDSALLPLWDGKVVARLQKVD